MSSFLRLLSWLISNTNRFDDTYSIIHIFIHSEKEPIFLYTCHMLNWYFYIVFNDRFKVFRRTQVETPCYVYLIWQLICWDGIGRRKCKNRRKDKRGNYWTIYFNQCTHNPFLSLCFTPLLHKRSKGSKKGD